MLVVTTEGIPGYQVRAVIGEVVGVTARSFNPFLEGVKSLNGRLNPQLIRLFAQTRQEAVARMVEAAQRRGANAIIGMRFDHRAVTGSWNEICAYGTAVLVAEIDQNATHRGGAAGHPGELTTNQSELTTNHSGLPADRSRTTGQSGGPGA